MDQSTIKESVRQAISRALAVTRWRKETLAAEIGVQSSTVRRWATGKVDDYTLLPVASLFRLAGLSLDEALGLRASVPSKGVDDSRVWQERAEMYEGLLKILTKQALPVANQPLVTAGEGMSPGAVAKLPGVADVSTKQKELEPAENEESRISNERSRHRRTGTG